MQEEEKKVSRIFSAPSHSSLNLFQCFSYKDTDARFENNTIQ